MAEPPEVWITGVGIVSCLGEGLDAHWNGLRAPSSADTTSFAPYVVHRIVPLDLDKQIPKKGDQRQMEPWQRIGTYAAGLALDSAGLKGNTDLLAQTDMIVAASGGERDANVDISVLIGLRETNNHDAYLNQRLMSDLRPTLFLAQLSNLLAGNISIVHGVTGSSRTFMGEEAAGISAAQIAHARIAAGQSQIALIGGAYNAERPEALLNSALGRFLSHDRHASVWERDGMELGSLGAFLVLEEKSHAIRRSANPLARLARVVSDHVERAPGAITQSLERMWSSLAPAIDMQHAAVISGASGVAPVTAEERDFLGAQHGLAVRATGTHLGQGVEPQFFANIALAAAAVQRRLLFPPTDSSGVEQDMEAPLRQAVVTGVGHWRGEGLALVAAVA